MCCEASIHSSSPFHASILLHAEFIKLCGCVSGTFMNITIRMACHRLTTIPQLSGMWIIVGQQSDSQTEG